MLTNSSRYIANEDVSYLFELNRIRQMPSTKYEIQLGSVHIFYKKLGSGHSIKSFLISHEILSILVLKSFLNWFPVCACKIINVVANTAPDVS